ALPISDLPYGLDKMVNGTLIQQVHGIIIIPRLSLPIQHFAFRKWRKKVLNLRLNLKRYEYRPNPLCHSCTTRMIHLQLNHGTSTTNARKYTMSFLMGKQIGRA